MILKPQDIVVVLKLVALKKQPWSYVQLANEPCMSASEINAGVKRAIRARLLEQLGEDKQPQPNRKALEEFLIHGVKYAFPTDHGSIVRGMKTSYAISPIADQLIMDGEFPPVWPYAEGKERGVSFSPLYRSVPMAAEKDAVLYELLALPDGSQIRRVTAPCFIATKIEAFHGRGRGDFIASHDFEDIVTVINGREELYDEIVSSEQSLREFIAASFSEWSENLDLFMALAGQLPPDSESQKRYGLLERRFMALASMQ